MSAGPQRGVKRPWTTLASATAVLLVIATPACSDDAEAEPPDSGTDVLEERWDGDSDNDHDVVQLEDSQPDKVEQDADPCVPSTLPTLAEFIDILAANSCKQLCGESFDEQHCKKTQAKLLAQRYASFHYDAQNAGRCMQSEIDPACDKAVCSNVLQPMGTKTLGQSCMSTDDCASVPNATIQCRSWVAQNITGGFISGRTCQQIDIAKSDERCDETSYPPPNIVHDCADTDVCKNELCIKRHAEGQECYADGECNEGLYCNDNNECAAYPSIGQPCSTVCAPGAYCNAKNMCAEQKPIGKKCAAATECSSGICYGFSKRCVAPPVCVPPEQGPVMDYYEQYAKAFCTKYASLCCNSAGAGFHQDVCEIALINELSQQIPSNATVDQTQAQACLQWLNNKTICDWMVGPNKLTPDSPCDHVVQSPDFKAPGQPCMGTAECKQPPQGDAICADGICTQIIPAKTGDPCVDLNTQPPDNVAAVCAVTDYCDPATRKCVVKGGSSAPCSSAEHCAGQAICSESGCKAKTADGQSCTEHEQCASWLCETGKCTPKRAHGQPCDNYSQCLGTCINGICRRQLGPEGRFCLAR